MYKVDLCGINTSQLKVLKESEKVELLKQMQAGDPTAREKLITGNLKLVLSVIQRFDRRGENPNDLFQVGCTGLMKAIDNFDLSQGVRFSTYAVPMIIGELRRYLRDFNPVRVSRSLRDTAYRAMNAKEKLTAKLDREPTAQEIAQELDLPRTEVVLALESMVGPVSLYEPVYSDGGDTIYVLDQLGDDQGDSWVDLIALKEQIRSLPAREKRILQLRFQLGKTQTEVAREIGISQAQVSRLEKSALKWVKGEPS